MHTEKSETITITKPDDFHLHVRDGEVLSDIVPHTARHFARALIMPNLKPPVSNIAQALAYRDRILAVLDDSLVPKFNPLMSLYLTDNTPKEEVLKVKNNEHVYAFKVYPAGATTNSDAGVTDLLVRCADVLEELEKHQVPLLLHGEVTDPATDIFDREKIFIDKVLEPLLHRYPNLKVVFEHITTKDAVDYIMESKAKVAATITPQHLHYNRNALFMGGVRPHWYCLPILKKEPHRQALVKAATSGDKRFFLGTDSAPHTRKAKENACGCAGCFSALHAVSLYAEVFDEVGALDKLEGFASHFGADFYGLPRNVDQITLVKKSWIIPEQLSLGDDVLVPLAAGESLRWSVQEL